MQKIGFAISTAGRRLSGVCLVVLGVSEDEALPHYNVNITSGPLEKIFVIVLSIERLTIQL